jgi:hypothetical protein
MAEKIITESQSKKPIAPSLTQTLSSAKVIQNVAASTEPTVNNVKSTSSSDNTSSSGSEASTIAVTPVPRKLIAGVKLPFPGLINNNSSDEKASTPTVQQRLELLNSTNSNSSKTKRPISSQIYESTGGQDNQNQNVSPKDSTRTQSPSSHSVLTSSNKENMQIGFSISNENLADNISEEELGWFCFCEPIFITKKYNYSKSPFFRFQQAT